MDRLREAKAHLHAAGIATTLPLGGTRVSLERHDDQSSNVAQHRGPVVAGRT